ncbi:dipeptidyl aminopeptidase [Cellulomonas chitinilytica]|uniref:Dipeptidyl aminopeptidase n=1 Tax=Cellulomonas chitinilytica TaxID=398759 RepID=A0A919U1I6_9CELL|nr:S9 family peptidase [Cellulomonas chitinilytica]GIG23183.1 dipeptidyl aminopeptidase [Cellulomonas chitinilytica]
MIPDDLPLLRVPGAAAVLPDGSAAIVSVTHPDLESDEYVGQLWSVPLTVDGPSVPTLLTRGHRDTAPDVSPDGRWVAFCRAEPQGKPQVFVVEATGGEPVRLTDAPLGAASPRFSPDGTRIAFLARVPDEGRYESGGDPAGEPPRHITELRYRADDVGFYRDRPKHLFVVELPTRDLEGAEPPTAESPTAEPPTAVALTAGDLEVGQARWLPSGDALVVTAARHGSREQDLRSDAVLVPARPDGAPQPPRPVTDADAGSTLDVHVALPSTDGSTLWLVATDLGASGLDFVAAHAGLYRMSLDEGGAPLSGPERLTDEESVSLLESVLVEADGSPLVAGEHRGAVHLFRLDERDALVPVLAGTHVVSGVAATADGRRAVVTAAGPSTAGDLLEVDLGTVASRSLTDLSAPLVGTGRVRVPVELTTFAPDGYPVHGWVVHPDPERFGAGPHPTVLMVHGGPFAQYTHALFDEVQVLAEAGYAVVLGNPRGSSGYGRAHGRAIRGAFGTVDADDVLALLDAALADPTLDGDRVGVMGGSYGGYMTAWLTTRTDRFVGAIVERGFLDPVSFVGSSDIGWFFGLAYLGDDRDDEGAAALAAQSPMAHVDAVRTPTLVIHSEQDWRCPVEQGQRWFVELKRRGVEAELLLFPGEGHELTRSGRPRHRKQRFDHVLAWWARHLPVQP